jgi:pectinesterase
MTRGRTARRYAVAGLALLLGAALPRRARVAVHLAGDSTMAPKLSERRPETGWGEAFQSLLDPARFRVVNHAVNGRSTRTFIEEGRWKALLDSVRAGDWVFIQFGHNDASPDKVDRYTNPTDYRRNLERFIADVRAKKANPLLLTPVVRRRFDSTGKFFDSHGEYPDIVRSVAKTGVPFIDAHRLTWGLVEGRGAEGSRRLFLHVAKGTNPNYPEGVEDNTHFSPEGAAAVARLMRDAFVGIADSVDGVREGAPVQRPASQRRVLPDSFDFVVAKDGSGNFRTIQEAINAVRDYTPIPRAIFVKNGVYREKLLIPEWKTGITLVGESVAGTIVEWDDHAGKGPINTFTSYTARISGDDIHVHNITFVNSAGRVGQALALFVDGDRVLFENCRFIGNQDTIFAAGEGARQYFKDVYVEGTTDFIFGPATAYFERCEVRSKQRSYITAASTPAGVPYGFVFDGCRLTAEASVDSVYLGRPWRDHARTVFLRTEMGSHIIGAGWHNWGRPEAERTSYYAEFASTGAGASGARASWSRRLTAAEASSYSRDNVLCGGPCGASAWFDQPARTR